MFEVVYDEHVLALSFPRFAQLGEFFELCVMYVVPVLVEVVSCTTCDLHKLSSEYRSVYGFNLATFEFKE